MSEHPNVARARAVFDGFAAGDSAVWDMLSDDITWHIGGDNQISGTYRGPQEVIGLLGRMAELSGGTYEAADIHDILANDDHAVALVRVGGQRDGSTLDTRAVFVVHVEDGIFTELFLTYEDDAAANAFWG